MKALITNPAMTPPDAVTAPLREIADIVTVPDGSAEALLEAARYADALIVAVEPIRAPLIAELRRCRLIHRCGIGTDVVDIEAATRKGIQVTNVPDANFHEVAAHAMALILALTRRLVAWDANVRAGKFGDGRLGMSLHRPDVQTVGLIGLGRIGRRVAAAARAVGFSVIAYDPAISADDAAALDVTLADTDDVIASADVLSLHVPLTDATRHLLDAAALSRMKRGAFVINVSRGGLIDEAALAEAVASKKLGGAGIDTFEIEPLPADSPLLGVDGILLSPHAAHWSRESLGETMVKSFAEVARVLRGEAPHHPVNRV
ncbi:C-terminal binding protein [Mycolicibacterium sp. S2-37]|uniref:C-terminal binding protein n=1 Tax=Mycolicibacterium sp. S2-37 TaxID=2810297 RepID=UPI001A946CFB|nr:C-terminal binding protein [Mycolicibacterium sp. S2-37]MBO0679054.1 C-terminal binding protein [Mycolicibacterium sp. S2-37]